MDLVSSGIESASKGEESRPPISSNTVGPFANLEQDMAIVDHAYVAVRIMTVEELENVSKSEWKEKPQVKPKEINIQIHYRQLTFPVPLLELVAVLVKCMLEAINIHSKQYTMALEQHSLNELELIHDFALLFTWYRYTIRISKRWYYHTQR